MNYYDKYLKYKNKYLLLKSQLGGIEYTEPIISCDNDIVLKNRIGSCWNLSIQILFFFSDKTRVSVQNKLHRKLPKDIVYEATNILETFLPVNLLNENKRMTEKTKNTIIKIVELTRDKFENKVYNDIPISNNLTIDILYSNYLNNIFYDLSLEF